MSIETQSMDQLKMGQVWADGEPLCPIVGPCYISATPRASNKQDLPVGQQSRERERKRADDIPHFDSSALGVKTWLSLNTRNSYLHDFVLHCNVVCS